MRSRAQMHEVELDDPDDAPEPEPAPRPRWTRRRTVATAGAAVGVLALAGAQWVATARSGADAARLAEVPGVIDRVDDTLEVVRALEPQDLATLAGEPSGALLRDADGSQSYRWFDPVDEGWTTQLSGPSAALADATRVYSDTSCVPDAVEDARRVVCLVTDAAQVVAEDGGLDHVAATTTEITVLDTADGSVLARWPQEAATSVAALPGDLVVVGTLTEELATVTAHDALTGQERWRHEEAWTPGPGDLSVVRAGDVVAFAAPDGSLTLLSAEGAVVRDDLTLSTGETAGLGWGWSWQHDPRDSTLVVVGRAFDGSSRSTFLGADGDPAADVTVPGEPVRVTVDDGSVPGLQLTGDGVLYAWDSASGAQRWALGVRSTTTALVVRGRVYVTTDRAVVAIDGRSGDELWRSEELDGLVPSALLTDSTQVLVAADRTGTGATPALVGYALGSGVELIRAPYPDGVIEVGAVGRTLVGRDAESDEQVELD